MINTITLTNGHAGITDAQPMAVPLEKTTNTGTVNNARQFTAHASSVPDMTILRRVATDAPKLDLAAFGDDLSEWISDAAKSKSAPVDFVALTILSAAAGAIGAARWVSPADGWREPAILWSMLVGAPSASKSPAMDAVRDPLTEIERELAVEWPKRLREFETAKVTAKARREQWEEAARTATKSGTCVELMPAEAEEPQEPQMPRIVISDATIEAVAVIESGNPRGLLLWRDECAAWLGNMGKYGDGDRAFWLEASGGRPFTVDRRKLAQPLRIEHHAISIVAGSQPDRLASLLMAGADDGLVGRFLYVWPESVSPCRWQGKLDATVIARVLRRLAALPMDQAAEGIARPVTLQVDANARDAFDEWRQAHFKRCEAASGLMASALGKMPGQALRLALILQLLTWASGPEGAPEPIIVSGDALGFALDLFDDYFEPMLGRVLGEAALPEADRDAAALARAIVSRRATTLNARTIRREWRVSGLREAKSVKIAIDALVEAGWLTPTAGRSGETSGRRRSDYAVNLQVFGGAT